MSPDGGGEPPHPEPADVLAFWRAAGPQKWFRKDAAFDREIEARFLASHEAAAAGRLAEWEATPDGALALLLLLDQFPRNMFRDSARAFATDPPARAVAERAIAHGFDARVASGLRVDPRIADEHRPLPARPDLMIWQLWSRNRQDQPQGVFSHATALTLHDLSDAMPAKLDMTVPPGFQRMAPIPGVLRLHRARMAARDVETIDGVRVTTPLRTLIDVMVDADLAPELQTQAIGEALGRGLILRRQIEHATVSTRARQRINRILKQVPDGHATPIRHSRGATDRPRNTPARTVSPRRR